MTEGPINESMERPETERIGVLVVVLIISLAGLAMRFFGLETRGVWYDEIELWNNALSGFARSHDGPLTPTLVFSIMWLRGQVDPYTLHIVPAVLGACSIPLVYLFARTIVRTRPALIATFLYAISPLAIYLSQEARPYGAFLLLSSVVYLSFCKAYLTDKRRWWALYAFGLMLAFMTHMLTLQILLAFSVFVLWRMSAGKNHLPDPKRLRSLGINFGCSSTAAFVLGTFWVTRNPNLPPVITGTYPLGVHDFIMTILGNLGPGMYYPYLENSVYAVGTEVAAVFLFCFCIYGITRMTMGSARSLFPLLLTVTLLSVSIDFLTLGERGTWPWARYISHLLAPYLVMVAAGIDAFQMKFSSAVLGWTLAIAVLVVTYSPGLHFWFQDAGQSRSTGYQVIAKEIESISNEIDGILVHNPYGSIRVASMYSLYRSDTLPMFHVSDGTIKTIVTKPSRANLTTLLEVGVPLDSPLPPGSYALVSPTVRQCERLGLRFSIHTETIAQAGKPPICNVGP